MKQIVNPFLETRTDEYQCFGCSPHNKNGLKLKFWDLGDEIMAKWRPGKDYEGYIGVLHGGIQATLMDEIASWAVYISCQTAGVTSRLNVIYKKPVYIEKGDVTVKAKVKDFKRGIASIKCELYDGENFLCAEGDVIYFCFSEEIAREKYMYPGPEAFYRKA